MKKLTKEKALEKVNNKFNLLKYWFKYCNERKMYTKKERKEIESIIKIKNYNMGIYCGEAPVITFNKDYYTPSQEELVIPSYHEYCENSELNVNKAQFIGTSRIDGSSIFQQKLIDGRILCFKVDFHGNNIIILEGHVSRFYSGTCSTGQTYASTSYMLNE